MVDCGSGVGLEDVADTVDLSVFFFPKKFIMMMVAQAEGNTMRVTGDATRVLCRAVVCCFVFRRRGGPNFFHEKLSRRTSVGMYREIGDREQNRACPPSVIGSWFDTIGSWMDAGQVKLPHPLARDSLVSLVANLLSRSEQHLIFSVQI